jgi:dipeptidyl aminopeptidase/acylaminoacyl peptidase
MVDRTAGSAVRRFVSIPAALALVGACAAGAETSVHRSSGGYTGWHASWSSDRTEIADIRAWSRPRDDAPFVQPVVATPDRRGWRVVANKREADEDAVYYLSPTLSPNGQEVAFAKRIGERGSWQIYVAGAYRSAERRLTEQGDNVEPAWSPPGDLIAFSRGRWPVEAGEIRLIRPDGSGERTLTPGRSPAWSPDGRKLAFVRDDRSIRVRDLSDGTEQKLADGGRPAWSPDGSQIAFVRSRRISPSGPSYLFLYVVNADGTGVREVGVWERFANKWARWANPVPAFTDAADTSGPLDLRKVVATRRGDMVLIQIETERAWKPPILRRAARMTVLVDAGGDGRPDVRGRIRLRSRGLVLEFSGRRPMPVAAPDGSTLKVSFSVRQIARRRTIRVAVETSFRGSNCPRACRDRLPEGGWLSTQYR